MILGRRMRKLASEVKKFNIIAPIDWLRRIDQWRRRQADVPSLSEAIRRLVTAQLDAEDKPKGGKGKGR
jgi:hypothetical protein